MIEQEESLIQEILINADLESYKNLFESRTRRYKYWIAYDGGIKTGALDDMMYLISPEIAFKSIPSIIELLLNQNDNDLFTTALSLLSNIVRASNTSEMPLSLSRKNYEKIESRVSQIDTKDVHLLWEDIKKWYRIECHKQLILKRREENEN